MDQKILEPATTCYSSWLHFSPKDSQIPCKNADVMTSVSSVVATIFIVGSNVRKSIIYVALLLQHATITTKITTAPTTMYLDVALETIQHVIGCYQTPVTLIIANIFFNSDHSYTSNIEFQISPGKHRFDWPNIPTSHQLMFLIK